MKSRVIMVLAVSLLTAGCATWSGSEVTQDGKVIQAVVVPENERTAPEDIILTEADITDKEYTVIGDIEVFVNKTTIFNADPTPEMVEEKLRERASELGADAVIFVRNGSVGVSAWSWGSLEGRGRAVSFSKNQ